MQVIVRYLQASWGWCEWEAGVELKSSLEDLTMIDEKAFFLIDFFYSRIFQTSIGSPGDGIALNCICYDVEYTRTTLIIDMFIALTFHVLVSPNVIATEPSKETQNAFANCITLSKMDNCVFRIDKVSLFPSSFYLFPFQTFLFNNPLKKSKLLLSLCNSHLFPVGLSSQPNSSATSKPQSAVIPLILALTPPSCSNVTI